MARPYRFLSVAVLGALGAAMATALAGRAPAPGPQARPAFLPVAHARPVETSYADTLRKGETLSQLLARARIDAEQARALLDQIQALQDPRRVRAGLVLKYRTATENGSVRRAELALDADHRLRVDGRRGQLVAEVEEVPVRADTAVLVGKVRSSLYQALLQGEGTVPRGERERIADILADRIFAWKVDFSRDIQPGDGYRIVYERMARPDGSARDGRVLAVQFEVGGRLQEAYLFRQGGVDDYFDGEGESLRRAFLRAPLEFRRIASGFSSGRYHPILHRVRAHRGIDYAASTGTPIRAVGDGVVSRAGWSGGYGNVVQLEHGRGYASRYGHMSRIAVRGGQRVKQGDVIGYVGMTGLATGPHLHYEFHTGGRAVDPNSMRHLMGEPVRSGNKDDFRALVAMRSARMQRADTEGAVAAVAGRSAGRGD
jgi:murein DD-endopeptidase MepM/ murein hydrolase activator NlpD